MSATFVLYFICNPIYICDVFQNPLTHIVRCIIIHIHYVDYLVIRKGHFMGLIPKYEDLTIQSRFIFNKVMQNEQICKKLLSEILNVKIDKIIYREEEKTIENAIDSRGIRCDVYIKDDKHTVYNIEMQSTMEKSLSKRSRYYQSMIDSDLLERGEEYSGLNKSYIIFICCFDFFGKNLYRYTFENICIEDNRIKLNDGTTRIFLNAKGYRGDVSEETKNFLKYVDGQFTEDSFSAILKAEVEKVKQSKEGKHEYMRWSLFEHDIKHKYKTIYEEMYKEMYEELYKEKFEEADRLIESAYKQLEDANKRIAESEQIKAESEKFKSDSLQKFVISCKQLGASKDKVLELLQQHFELSKDDAIKYAEQYW